MKDFDRKAAAKIVAAVIVALTALLQLLESEPEAPVEPKPLPFVQIATDDGTAKAWLIDKGGEYILDRDLDAAETAIFVTAPSNVTLDLGGHTVTFGSSGKPGCVGVNPWKATSSHLGFGANDKRFAAQLPAPAWKSRTLTIKNGTIRHTGPPTSSFAACVGGDYVFNVALHDVEMDVSGADAACVSASSVTISDCIAVNRSRVTVNRHQVPANIRADHLVATDNLIVGGNSGLFVGNGTATIERNVIRNHSFATNGYGVMLYRCRAVSVSQNLIAPTNGRGIIDNGPHELGNREPVNIRDNLIVVHELPNAEFGNDLQATCVRSRYAADNLQVTGNRCLAIAGGEYVSGMAIYLTHRPGSESNVIKGNEFASVLIGDVDLKGNKYAASLGLIGNGVYDETESVCPDVIRDNRLLTNCFALALSHTDGGCNQDVHCRSVAWASGQEIIHRFADEVERSQIMPTEAKAVADELRSINVTSDPYIRAWLYAGRWLGSRADITVDEAINADVSDVHFANRAYRFAVTINGRTITKE